MGAPELGRAPARVRTPFRRRVGEWVRGPGQLAVWLLVGGVGLWLVQREAAPAPLRGIAEARPAELAFGRSGRVAELLAFEGDPVAAGAPVARLDGTAFDATLAVAQEEVAALAAEVAAAVADGRVAAAERRVDAAERRARGERALLEVRSDAAANAERRADRIARLAIEARSQRLSAAALVVELDGDRLLAERLGVRAARARALADQGIDDVAIAEELELEEREVRARIAANESLLERTRAEAREAEVAVAEARASEPSVAVEAAAPPDAARELEEAAREADAARLEALEGRLAVRRAALEALRVEASGLELVSPVAGRVERVVARPGTSVLAGAPVVVVRPVETEAVVVYLPEGEAAGEIPVEVVVARAADPSREATARVRAVGPAVELLPEALWAAPTLPEYGRPLLVEPPPELGLVPGERVRARR